MKLPTGTCVAKLSALKGLDLLGATIDARCARITLRDAGLAAGTTEGLPLMHLALNQRNLSITEASRKSSRMAIIAYAICGWNHNAEWPVNLQVIIPVQGLVKAGARSL